MEFNCFEPIIDSKSKVLILGTMPGEASIKAKEYYAHTDNLFWDIIFRICIQSWKMEELVIADYDSKVQLLYDNNIAVWDVLQFCNRKGSLDKDILNQIQNDFNLFLKQNSQIKAIFFNGKKAFEYFENQKLSKSILNNIKLITLPSTSPSNTKNSFYILKEWLQIRKFLNEEIL